MLQIKSTHVLDKETKPTPLHRDTHHPTRHTYLVRSTFSLFRTRKPEACLNKKSQFTSQPVNTLVTIHDFPLSHKPANKQIYLIQAHPNYLPSTLPTHYYFFLTMHPTHLLTLTLTLLSSTTVLAFPSPQKSFDQLAAITCHIDEAKGARKIGVLHGKDVFLRDCYGGCICNGDPGSTSLKCQSHFLTTECLDRGSAGGGCLCAF